MQGRRPNISVFPEEGIQKRRLGETCFEWPNECSIRQLEHYACSVIDSSMHVAQVVQGAYQVTDLDLINNISD